MLHVRPELAHSVANHLLEILGNTVYNSERKFCITKEMQRKRHQGKVLFLKAARHRK